MGIAADDVRVRSGIVTPAQVSHLVDMPRSTLSTWTRATGRRPVMVHAREPMRRGWPSIPLVGLAEAAALRALRTAGMRMSTAVEAAEFIREHFGDEYAMANPKLVTDGAEAFIFYEHTQETTRIRDRQGAFTEILRGHLRPLVIGPDRYVQAFGVTQVPDADLLIDPRFNAGRLSFSNRVPVFSVLGLLAAGESAQTIASDFGLRPSEVQAVERERDWLAEVA